MTESKKTKIGITIGDVNGIGPEIVLKTFADSRLLDLCTVVIYGSFKALQFHKTHLHLPDLPLHRIKDLEEVKKNKVNVIDVSEEEIEVNFGHPGTSSGRLAFRAMELAVDHALAGEIDAIVTAPVNKKSIQEIYEPFTGHTGYLSERSGTEALMILCSEKLRIAMVTGHIPISKISSTITTELIIQRIESFHRSLVQDFGRSRPKIAVLGLNPHSGEGGLLGREEIDVIQPAIAQVKTKSILAFGPYPADGFFGAGTFRDFDGVLAMYHDQALIPFKTMSFEDGVNFSANLAFIRTSPDHGTAFEIAGKKSASEGSFRQAVYMAIDVWRRRVSSIGTAD